MANKESDFTKVTTLGNNDLIRCIKDGSSRNITKSNFVTDINDLLVALGFLKTSTSTISNTRKVVTSGVNHTLVLTDDVVLMDATAANLDVDLMFAADAYTVASTEGQRFTIKKIDASAANTVTIKPAGADLIDGQTSITLSTALRPFVTIVTDGADWWLI